MDRVAPASERIDELAEIGVRPAVGPWRPIEDLSRAIKQFMVHLVALEPHGCVSLQDTRGVTRRLGPQF